MDMQEIHEAALDSYTVSYHEFLLHYNAGEQIVYGFVEGKDDPSFYRGIIESNIPNGWEVKVIKSGNKAKVLKTFDIMDWSRFPKKRVCFFVDRDLSEFLDGETHSSKNIYVTDNYSIENDAVNFKTMERVLVEIFGMTDIRPEEYKLIKTCFESNLVAFSEAMVPVMAQILLWRRAGDKVHLDKIEPKKFFSFKNSRIKLKSDLISTEKRVQYAASCVSALQSSNKDIAGAEAEFRAKQGPEKYIRGKYLLWFFIQVAKEIHKETPNICKNHKVVPKIHIELGIKNAIAVIAPRVRCPVSLKLFLERNYVTYINEVAFAA